MQRVVCKLNYKIMTLEQKIRNAIPELMELGVGCEFEIELANKSKRKCFVIDDSEISKIAKVNVVWFFYKNKENESRCDFFYKSTILELATIIGKPIQLNHVLEYLSKLEVLFFIRTFKDGSNLYLAFDKGSVLWNLKSNLLSEQSQELKNFINELA